MEKEARRKVIEDKLIKMGETLHSWAKKENLNQKIVEDLVEGKLLGTRGVPMQTRQKMEEVFGDVFEK